MSKITLKVEFGEKCAVVEFQNLRKSWEYRKKLINQNIEYYLI